jgi:hypothetical protein
MPSSACWAARWPASTAPSMYSLQALAVSVAAHLIGPIGVLSAAPKWSRPHGPVVFESASDWQLARFRANPGNQGLIMDRGLWRYTRHPNYFGDFCMWWGLFLITLGSWAELPTVVGPPLMTYILTRGTGQRLTDRRMAATRPGTPTTPHGPAASSRDHPENLIYGTERGSSRHVWRAGPRPSPSPQPPTWCGVSEQSFAAEPLDPPAGRVSAGQQAPAVTGPVEGAGAQHGEDAALVVAD